MKKSLLILGLLVSCCFAQTLSLEQCISKTLLNNPDIQSFILKTQQSKESYNASYADFLPQINLQAQYDFTQTQVTPSNGAFNTVEKEVWNVGATLKQKIWDFEKTSSKIEAFKIDEDIATLSLKSMQALMVYKIKSLYKLLVVQKEAIEVRKKDLDSKKAYYEQAKALVVQGLKTKADSSRFSYEFLLAEENLSIAQASFDKTKNSLALYIGEKIEKDVILKTNIIKKNYSLKEDLEQEEILVNNLELKIDALTINKNKFLYKSTKASHYGSLDAVATYKHFDTLNSYNTSSVGVVLDIPLYSGGSIQAEAQKAKIAVQVAKQELASKILSTKEKLVNLLKDIARYNKTIASKQAQLLWANDTKDVLYGRYKEGVSTYIELLDAQSLILNAKLGLLEAYYTKSTAIDQIDYLKGKIQ